MASPPASSIGRLRIRRTAVNGYLISDEFLHRDPASAHRVDGRVAARVSDRGGGSGACRAPERTRGSASIAFAAQSASGTRLREGQVMPENALAADAAAEQIAESFGGLRPVQFTAIRYPGIDAVGHYYPALRAAARIRRCV
jgi:hypothetical protein